MNFHASMTKLVTINGQVSFPALISLLYSCVVFHLYLFTSFFFNMGISLFQLLWFFLLIYELYLFFIFRIII